MALPTCQNAQQSTAAQIPRAHLQLASTRALQRPGLTATPLPRLQAATESEAEAAQLREEAACAQDELFVLKAQSEAVATKAARELKAARAEAAELEARLAEARADSSAHSSELSALREQLETVGAAATDSEELGCLRQVGGCASSGEGCWRRPGLQPVSAPSGVAASGARRLPCLLFSL